MSEFDFSRIFSVIMYFEKQFIKTGEILALNHDFNAISIIWRFYDLERNF